MAQAVRTNEYFYTPTEKSSSGGKGLLNILQVLAIILVIIVVMYLIVLLPNQVDGQSMEPNFHDQEQLFTDKVINYVTGTSLGDRLEYNYYRGDVVVFPHGERSFIKRIIAVGGDTIRIENDSVFINGQKIRESYIPEGVPTRLPFGNISFMPEAQDIFVPEDSFFVMGDNRTNSQDSRFAEVGFVTKDELSGRVFLRYWPLNRFGLIERGEITFE